MIRVVAPAAPPDVAFALALLVDLSRLLPVDDGAAPVVELHVGGDGPHAPSLRDALSNGWYVRAEDGRVTVPASVLALVAALAGAEEEQRTEARDRYDRVPSSANALVAAGAERTPVVSEAAVALREAVHRAAARRPVRLLSPWPEGRRWAAALTHDVDVVAAWPLFTGLRVTELLRRGERGQAIDVARAALLAATSDPVSRALVEVLDVEARHGVSSTWFFLCGTPTPRTFARGDLTFRPESRRARRLLGDVVRSGHEVGLHGSFATLEDAGAMAGQRSRLERLGGGAVGGIRQHFLRMRPGATQASMQQAGFRYDATYGFPDRNGFRLGVADVVPAWSAPERRTLDLELVPLTWMDRALSKYAGVERPDAWVDDALELAATVRAMEGLWVGLWHPNLAPALGYPGAPAAYRRLVEALLRERPYVAPLRTIVEWRTARRSLRVHTLSEDARSASFVGGAPGAALTLENERGTLDRDLVVRVG